MTQIRSFKRNVTGVDWATLGYVGLTAIIVAMGWGKIDQAAWHLVFRLFIASGIVVLVAKQDRLASAGHFIRDFYPLILFGFFYSETDSLNNLLFPDFDPFIATVEEYLFGGQPSLQFSVSFPQPWLAELMHFAYFSYYLIVLGVCLYIWRFNNRFFPKTVFVVSVSFYIYYLIFIAFPVAGPQFYFLPPDNSIPEGCLFGKLMHVIHQLGERPTAAFPSSHVGVALILCYLSARYARPLFKFVLLLFVLLCFSTVYLKAHYLIDVIAGFLSAPVLLVLSLWLNKKFGRLAQIKI
jgi:membrane-associated phospholipid phosphatase